MVAKSKVDPMLHPMLSPRLYCQTRGQLPLRPLRPREAHLVRDYLLRSVWRFYERSGAGLGLVLGLAIAFWIWLPAILR